MVLDGLESNIKRNKCSLFSMKFKFYGANKLKHQFWRENQRNVWQNWNFNQTHKLRLSQFDLNLWFTAQQSSWFYGWLPFLKNCDQSRLWFDNDLFSNWNHYCVLFGCIYSHIWSPSPAECRIPGPRHCFSMLPWWEKKRNLEDNWEFFWWYLS